MGIVIQIASFSLVVGLAAGPGGAAFGVEWTGWEYKVFWSAGIKVTETGTWRPDHKFKFEWL